MKKHILLTGLICFLFMFALTNTAISANYPSKAIRMVCPWDAGGGADAITRTISFYAQKNLPNSSTIYVENVTGGLTSVGIFDVMRAPKDGYTLGSLTYDSVTTVPRKKMIAAYDLDKLAYIANITREEYGLIVREDAPWKNLAEFLADAKKSPKKIKIGMQGGLGGISHIYLIELEKQAGVQFRYVPYAGSAAQNEALLMGEADAISTSLGDAFTLLEVKKARGLAAAAAERNPKVPDCPTFMESGFDIQWGSFLIIAATAGTPPEELQILRDAFEKGANDPKFIEWTKEVGVEAAYMNAEDTKLYVDEIRENVNAILDDLVAQGLLKE